MSDPLGPRAANSHALIEAAMDAVSAADTLLGPARLEVQTGLTMQTLYRYATDPLAPEPSGFGAALRSDPVMARAWDHMLATTTGHHFGLAAAASSGSLLDQRNTAGARLNFRASKADADQVYVILEVDDPAAQPRLLFAKGPTGETHRYALPEAVDGRIQLLMDGNSDMVRGLRSVDWVVYVK